MVTYIVIGEGFTYKLREAYVYILSLDIGASGTILSPPGSCRRYLIYSLNETLFLQKPIYSRAVLAGLLNAYLY